MKRRRKKQLRKTIRLQTLSAQSVWGYFGCWKLAQSWGHMILSLNNQLKYSRKHPIDCAIKQDKITHAKLCAHLCVLCTAPLQTDPNATLCACKKNTLLALKLDVS